MNRFKNFSIKTRKGREGIQIKFGKLILRETNKITIYSNIMLVEMKSHEKLMYLI